MTRRKGGQRTGLCYGLSSNRLESSTVSCIIQLELGELSYDIGRVHPRIDLTGYAARQNTGGTHGGIAFIIDLLGQPKAQKTVEKAIAIRQDDATPGVSRNQLGTAEARGEREGP